MSNIVFDNIPIHHGLVISSTALFMIVDI